MDVQRAGSSTFPAGHCSPPETPVTLLKEAGATTALMPALECLCPLSSAPWGGPVAPAPPVPWSQARPGSGGNRGQGRAQGDLNFSALMLPLSLQGK